MLVEYINELLCSDRRLEQSHQVVTPDAEQKSSIPNPIKPIPENKYSTDIINLREEYGEFFRSGLCIKLSLQQLLEICPRDRRRVDAYRGLINYLQKEYNITLTITSQKKK